MNRTAITGSALGSLLALSVVLRALFPSVVVPAAQAGPKAEVTQSPPLNHPAEDPGKDGPWKAAQSYFAGWAPLGCGQSSGPSRLAVWCIPANMPVRAVIVIAPDPVRTHMALTFDRTLEGFQLAAQDAGYIIDRYWLPWSVTGTTTSGSESSKSSSDPSEDARDAAERERRASEPGLLLLRHSGQSATAPPLVFAFLVSDTPTAGIQGRQFANAVRYVGDVCTVQCAGDGTIRIVGPSFSGSLASLHKLTDAAGGQFVAYSGSVSSRAAIDDEKLPGPGSGANGTLSFKTFVHDTDSALQEFLGTLRNTHAVTCREPQVAILSEAATKFGEVRAAESSESCVQNFVFPREISNLRNASSANAATAATTTTDAAVAKQLPLNLTDPTNSSDAPPDFSRPQGPLSKEAVLMNIAAELRRARFRYVGVLASNILDDLFLAEFLRTACPDARLFMVSADLLFERELDNVPYVGMLSITTYPLILRNAGWTKGAGSIPSSVLPFADEYSVGQYNATLQTMKELLPDAETPSLRQVWPPRRSATPGELPPGLPLWMTVVGSGGYWPVRLLDGRQFVDTPQLETGDLSGAWQVLLVLTGGLAILHIGVLLIASPFAVRFRDFALIAAAPRQRLFFIQTSCATVVLALGFLLLPALRHATFGWLQAFGAAVVLIVVLTAVLLEALYYRRWRWLQTAEAASADATQWALTSQILTLAGIWLGTGLLLFLWWILTGPEGNAPGSLYGFFFAYRVVHPVSGVSPLPPLIPLLVAMYAWTCFEIWRLRFNDDMRPRLVAATQPAGASPRPRPGDLTERNIAIAVNRYLLRTPYLVPFATVFVIWLVFLNPLSPFELFERWTFGLVFLVLFCLVVALMLSSGFRMAEIWIDLRRLLIELERRPVRVAFSRVKGLTWSFWRQGGEDAEWAYMARSLEALAQLGSGTDPRESGVPETAYFAKQIQNVRKAVAELPAMHDAAKIRAHLKTLGDDLATLKKALSSADANSFLKSAVDDLGEACKACVTAPDSPNNESLESALAALGARADAAVAVVRLLTESAAAQGRLMPIIGKWRKLQEKRPLLTAVDSLREYASAPPPGSADERRVTLHHDLAVTFRELQESLATVLSAAWTVLETRWRKEASQLVDYEDRDAATEDKKNGSTDTAERQLRCLEEFVALRYVAFIRGVLGHLRHVMIFLALSFSLVLISLNIYSFEPHQSLIWSFTLIFIVTGFMVVGVLVQLHRDPILSRVTGTTGNALDLHFYLRIVAFGALPLLTLLAAHFPSIGHYLVSFLQPSLEALK